MPLSQFVCVFFCLSAFEKNYSESCGWIIVIDEKKWSIRFCGQRNFTFGFSVKVQFQY